MDGIPIKWPCKSTIRSWSNRKRKLAINIDAPWDPFNQFCTAVHHLDVDQVQKFLQKCPALATKKGRVPFPCGPCKQLAFSPLFFAIEAASVGIIPARNWTERPRYRMLTLLLEAKANPNALELVPYQRVTLLMFAMRRQLDVPYIELLLQYGADPNLEDPYSDPNCLKNACSRFHSPNTVGAFWSKMLLEQIEAVMIPVLVRIVISYLIPICMI